MPYTSTTIQVSEGVRNNLAVIAAQLQADRGRSGRVPYSEVIEYLIDEYKRAIPVRLDGCTCQAIAGSHKPPCPWAMS